MLGAGELIGFALFLAVVVLIVVGNRARRRKRDAELARLWEWATSSPYGQGWHLVFVQRVYQRARRGSKAVIVWCSTGQEQDTWFAGWHAPVGVYVLLTGGIGYGPHTRNPKVLFVEPGEVRHVIPAGAPRAWQRNERRIQKRAGRTRAGDLPVR
jgi:hypothetical protein